MATTQNLTTLNLNVLTKAQYDGATKSGNEIYLVTDDVTPIEYGGTGANNASAARTNLDVYSKSDVDNALNNKANKTHTHAISDITNLQTTLDSKAASSHSHSADNITSGILPIERGGTGANSVNDFVANLGLNNGMKLGNVDVILPTLTGNNMWNASAYGNGMCVLVGTDSVIAYSSDGITWNQTTMSSGSWNDVVYGGDRFIAVGDGKTAYSTDGVTWTEVTAQSTEAACIAYNNNSGKFVIVSEQKLFSLHSSDGTSWDEFSLPNLGVDEYGDQIPWCAIAYGNGKFVITSLNHAAYSEDGISWTTVDLPISVHGYINITYGNGMFVAPCYRGKSAACSVDGINWSKYVYSGSLSGGLSMSNCYISYCNGIFMTFDWIASDEAWCSTDGINWSVVTLPSNVAWRDVIYCDNRFIAIGANDSNDGWYTAAAYSSDGRIWLSEIPQVQDTSGNDITNKIVEAIVPHMPYSVPYYALFSSTSTNSNTSESSNFNASLSPIYDPKGSLLNSTTISIPNGISVVKITIGCTGAAETFADYDINLIIDGETKTTTSFTNTTSTRVPVIVNWAGNVNSGSQIQLKGIVNASSDSQGLFQFNSVELLGW